MNFQSHASASAHALNQLQRMAEWSWVTAHACCAESHSERMCLQAEVLWLMRAKEKWLSGAVGQARAVMNEAHNANPDSEDIWLAAFKLEFENAEVERARAILAKARESSASTARVWMKSAVVEREAGDLAAQRQLLLEGLQRFPDFAKLHLMLGQLEEQCGQPGAAHPPRLFGCGLGSRSRTGLGCSACLLLQGADACAAFVSGLVPCACGRGLSDCPCNSSPVQPLQCLRGTSW